MQAYQLAYYLCKIGNKSSASFLALLTNDINTIANYHAFRVQSTFLVTKSNNQLIHRAYEVARPRPTRQNNSKHLQQSTPVNTNLRKQLLLDELKALKQQHQAEKYDEVFGHAQFMKRTGKWPDQIENRNTQLQQVQQAPQYDEPNSTYMKHKRLHHIRKLYRHVFPQMHALYWPRMSWQSTQQIAGEFNSKSMLAKYGLKDPDMPRLTDDDKLYLLYLASPIMLAQSSQSLQNPPMTRDTGWSFYEALVTQHKSLIDSDTDAQLPVYFDHELTDSNPGKKDIGQSIAESLATEPNVSRYLQRQHQRAMAIKARLTKQAAAPSEANSASDSAESYALGLSHLYLRSAQKEPSEPWFEAIKGESGGDRRLQEALEADSKVQSQRERALAALEQRRKRQVANLARDSLVSPDLGRPPGLMGLATGSEAGTSVIGNVRSLAGEEVDGNAYSLTGNDSVSYRYGLAGQRAHQASGSSGACSDTNSSQQPGGGQQTPSDQHVENKKYMQHLEESFFGGKDAVTPLQKVQQIVDRDKLAPRAALSQGGSVEVQARLSVLPEMRLVDQVENEEGGAALSSDLMAEVVLPSLAKQGRQGPTFERDARGIVHVYRQKSAQKAYKGAALAAPRQKQSDTLDTSKLMRRWYEEGTEKQAIILDQRKLQTAHQPNVCDAQNADELPSAR